MLDSSFWRGVLSAPRTYDPTLSVVALFQAGTASPSPLLQEIAPPEKLKALTTAAEQHSASAMREELYANAAANLLAARQAGVPLIAGSDAGNPSIIHGPTVQRELALRVEAGIPATVALQAATGQAAKLLRADDRKGLIAPGK